jgi:hypothetical protein
MKKVYLILATILATTMLTSTAFAAETLFGSAVNDGGVIKTISDTSVPATTNDDYGAVSFDDTNGILFSALTNLSVDYNVTDDDCKGGAPRFSIKMDMNNDTIADGNLFVYLGPTPNFTGCTQNTWLSSGNLINDVDPRFDSTQLGGPFYGTYAQTLALLGTGKILRISLVTDAGWAFQDQEQEVWFDNVVINEHTYDFTPLLTPAEKSECKNDGWKIFNNPVFKNQGDCVSYVESNPKAQGNKNK